MASAAFPTVSYPLSPHKVPSIPSHILVVGSEGLVGKTLINFALQEGHCVKAFMTEEHIGFDARLLNNNAFSTCKGDIKREKDILAAVKGCSAVVLTCPSDSCSLNPIPEEVIKTFVHACRKFDCHRLICQGNAMASEEAQKSFFPVRFALSCCAPAPVPSSQEAHEHNAVLDVLFGSVMDLEWVVPRPAAVESGLSLGNHIFELFNRNLVEICSKLKL